MERITRNDILEAIGEIDRDGIRKGRSSSTYDLIHNGKAYPPKLVISIANRFATGEELDNKSFQGGKGTPAFNLLEKHGFKLISKNNVRQEYVNLESSVYEFLMEKHEADNNFTFSLRKKASKGAELDYFIGTSKSNYSAFTLWEIPVAYPGSSGNLTGFIFRQLENKFELYFEYSTSKANDKEEGNIQLGKEIFKCFKREGLKVYESGADSKQFTFYGRLEKSEFSNINELVLGLDAYFSKISPLVDEAVEVTKISYPNWLGHKITLEEFDVNHAKMLLRREKYSVILNENKELKSLIWRSVKINYPKTNLETKGRGYIQSNIREKLKIPETVSLVDVRYNSIIYSDATLLIDGRLSLKTENIKMFLKNNSSLNDGDVITIEVAYKTNQTREIDMNNRRNGKPTNQILYGPPGTGKTYHTINHALSIIENKRLEELEGEERKDLTERFENYKVSGQIVFTTFHQSMSYEDFVEGIKPSTNDNDDVVYNVEDGIFKEISIASEQISIQKNADKNIDFSNASYFKMSLGGKNRKEIHDWYLENEFIGLGWGGNHDYNVLQEKSNWSDFRDEYKSQFSEMVDKSKFNIQAVYAFQHLLKIGDIVLVSLGNNVIDAIGIVTGEYKYIDNSDFPFHHNRKVKWLAKDLAAQPKFFVDKKISQQSIYQFYDDDIKVNVFKEMFNKNESLSHEQKEYVLIIDEINRGNVSAIFGELITLIETDKRKGAKEELSVTLPYSKELFTVPSNLHIIGTMNTADRSVEALDTALRRRFTFKEMLPDPTVLETEQVGGIRMEDILTVINQRIELLIDRDHTIGHSYFIGVDSEEKLLTAFKDKVIPLLQEYFYGDYGKIGLVLGNGFVEKVKGNDVSFAVFKDYEDTGSLKQDNFVLKNLDKNNIIEAVIGIIK